MLKAPVAVDRDQPITSTSLSTRAKRALAKNDIHTVGELRLLLSKYGAIYIRRRMFGIGAVTAEEILAYLAD
mgnify:CR=1 FL=1